MLGLIRAKFVFKKKDLLTIGASFSRRKGPIKRFYAKKQVRGVQIGGNRCEMRAKIACLVALIFQTVFQRQTFGKSRTCYGNPNFCARPVIFSTQKPPSCFLVYSQKGIIKKKGSGTENCLGTN